MQQTWFSSWVGKIPLEKGMATPSSILAWRIPWTEEPVGYSPWGCKELDMTERLHVHFYTLVSVISPLTADSQPVSLSLTNPLETVFTKGVNTFSPHFLLITFQQPCNFHVYCLFKTVGPLP